MTVIEILLVVLILSASALCIFLIFSISKLLKEVEAVRADVHGFIEKANPVLNNLTEVSQKASRIVSEAENYWEELDRSIKRMKEKVNDVTSLRVFRDDNPVKELIKNLKALSKGFSAFWQSYKSY
jgi:archaellum component FlaC